ncbi:hypothetical protein JQN58_18930 [Aneurinibacillus sp. BA2021]|nr:hypothetical protein [Aneurinibacillus sp. BA2021]
MKMIYGIVSALVLLVGVRLFLQRSYSERRKEAKHRKELKRRAAHIHHQQQELDALSAKRRERLSKKDS